MEVVFTGKKYHFGAEPGEYTHSTH